MYQVIEYNYKLYKFSFFLIFPYFSSAKISSSPSMHYQDQFLNFYCAIYQNLPTYPVNLGRSIFL